MAGKKRNLSAKINEDGREYVDRKILIRKLVQASGIRYQVDLGKQFDKVKGKEIRKRETFSTLRAARECAWDRVRELKQSGREATLLTEGQRKDAAKGLAILSDFGINIQAAAEYYRLHHRPTNETTAIAGLVDTFIAEKKRLLDLGSIRERSYLNNITRTKPLKELFGARHIDTINPADINSLLDAYTPSNRANYRSIIRSFFIWAAEEGYSKSTNPVTKKTKVKYDAGDIKFYTPAEVDAVMRQVVALHPKMTAFFALGFFSGIRVSELQKLEWRDIRTTGSNPTVTVRDTIAKKRYTRRIKIEPNLLAWLATIGTRSGLIAPFSSPSLIRWRKEVFVAAKVGKLHNGMRHSYGSYHLQSRNHLGDLLQGMGHQDSKVLLKHYAGVTDKETADAYFEIMPYSDKVVQFQQGVA